MTAARATLMWTSSTHVACLSSEELERQHPCLGERPVGQHVPALGGRVAERGSHKQHVHRQLEGRGGAGTEHGIIVPGVAAGGGITGRDGGLSGWEADLERQGLAPGVELALAELSGEAALRQCGQRTGNGGGMDRMDATPLTTGAVCCAEDPC